MANSLLDFVMSLVRDPDAAARYAADPAQAIADADLSGVTSVDVNNLIPVVSESVSMTTPAVAFDSFGAEPAGNVWASGAATAAFDAFDAFDDNGPAVPVIDTPAVVTDANDDIAGADSDAVWSADPVSLQFDTPLSDDAVPAEADFADGWAQPPLDEPPVDHPSAFDLLD
ncbi:Rv0340 family IniB-related protein [Mycolicibacterium sp. F2034L]|uniref:Rv0340 family IniB-related protein n=1 Tax=Mycolicibacterium sp. F2034L TaxID=2926422 RepID=UPI001FF6A38C|nr:Rv0340 family IniB-related protein [Mycolicibacterium sp. F2034L]MCK0175517.1 Rv0340 family protein [Mycolicibacterium sp. F2034L]